MAAFFAASLCFHAEPVAAWGKDGHEIVGNLAWKLISNRTADIVKDILRRDDGSYGDDDAAGSPLASVADWADKARYSQAYHWSAPLHYIDVPDDVIAGGCPVQNRTSGSPATDSYACQFEYARDCADDWCVAGAIANYTSQLVVPEQLDEHAHAHVRQPDRLVRESLMFLVHFVGDIHQPLHCSRATDKGGNTISVHFNQSSAFSSRRSDSGEFSRRNLRKSHHSSNLHSVWDDSIIEKSMRDDFHGSRKAMQDDLFAFIVRSQDTEDWERWMACPDGGSRKCTAQWGEESLDYALTWAYRNVDGNEVQEGDELSGDYYETRLPVVKERLAVAGLRLAATLEMHLELAGQQGKWGGDLSVMM